jgi:hypothetical protein
VSPVVGAMACLGYVVAAVMAGARVAGHGWDVKPACGPASAGGVCAYPARSAVAVTQSRTVIWWPPFEC